MEQKFYICKHCGNIIAKVKDTGVPVICCGEPMSEIVPGTTPVLFTYSIYPHFCPT